MNAYNQGLSDKRNTRYKVDYEDDHFKLLVNKYLSDVQNTVSSVLQKTKNLSENDASNMSEDMFTLGEKRQKDIKDEVEDCYTRGKTLEQCAQQLIDKYYKIAKNNKHHNTQSYQTNRELSGDGEVTEVEESRIMTSFESFLNENSPATVTNDNFKRVSLSLFWNFMGRVKDLELKFNFNASYIKNIKNSLNVPGYILFLETPKINNREVEYEFKHSKMLSSILTYIKGKETDNETSFYIAFDSQHRVHFGFIINNKRYKIGFCLYNSYDFQKCIPYIDGTKDIDLFKLSKKFISNVETLNSIRTTIDTHLNKYEDDIEIYNTIIDNNFCVVIESVLDEVVSQKYLEDIIKKYVKFYHYSNWFIEKKKINEKTIYYLILK